MSEQDSKVRNLEEQTRIVKPTRRFGVLLGFLLKAEADAIFHQQPYETMDGSDPLELWRQFEGNRANLPSLGPAQLEVLPGSLDSLENLQAEPAQVTGGLPYCPRTAATVPTGLNRPSSRMVADGRLHLPLPSIGSPTIRRT